VDFDKVATAFRKVLSQSWRFLKAGAGGGFAFSLLRP